MRNFTISRTKDMKNGTTPGFSFYVNILQAFFKIISASKGVVLSYNNNGYIFLCYVPDK